MRRWYKKQSGYGWRGGHRIDVWRRAHSCQPYDNHHQIVSFATSYGDAERANVSGSLIVGAFLVLHS